MIRHELPNDPDLASAASAAQRLFVTLKERSLVAAFAESCTGGLCATLLTAIPGSSKIFAGAVVSYSNTVKTDLLGVDPERLASYGAVSRETVAAMAEGAAKRLRADCALAVSGVAGPDGGSEDKPVGTVWVAWRGPGFTEERRFHFEGDRAAIRAAAAEAALDGLTLHLSRAAPDKLQA